MVALLLGLWLLLGCDNKVGAHIFYRQNILKDVYLLYVSAILWPLLLATKNSKCTLCDQSDDKNIILWLHDNLNHWDFCLELDYL